MSFAMKRAMLAGAAVLLAFVLTGCGGGNGIYQSLAVTPTIMVSPATVNVQQGANQQFAATVTNSVDDTVTWEVNGVLGGNMLTGTIDINGVYTAPPVVPQPPNVTVTAVLIRGHELFSQLDSHGHLGRLQQLLAARQLRSQPAGH